MNENKKLLHLLRIERIINDYRLKLYRSIGWWSCRDCDNENNTDQKISHDKQLFPITSFSMKQFKDKLQPFLTQCEPTTSEVNNDLSEWILNRNRSLSLSKSLNDLCQFLNRIQIDDQLTVQPCIIVAFEELLANTVEEIRLIVDWELENV